MSSDNGIRQGLGTRTGLTVRQAGRQAGVRGRGPEQQRGDGAADRGPSAGHHGQGVHRERGGQRRDCRAGHQGGTGPGPGGRADQQCGRHNRAHVLGRHRPHHLCHHQHQPARTLLGESFFLYPITAVTFFVFLTRNEISQQKN